MSNFWFCDKRKIDGKRENNFFLFRKYYFSLFFFSNNKMYNKFRNNLYVLNSVCFFFFNENSCPFRLDPIFNHSFNESQLEIHYCETCMASISTRLWLCTIIKVRKINVNLRILRWTKHYHHTHIFTSSSHSIWPFFVSQPLKAREQRFRFNFFFFFF